MRYIVLMNESRTKFGYFSNIYGIIETSLPKASTFMDVNAPIAQLIKKVQTAKEATIRMCEEELEARKEHDRLFMNDRSRIMLQEAEDSLQETRNKTWVIVELSGSPLAVVK